MQFVKLGFRDVLIKPRFTTLSSRSEVNLLRTFTFPNSMQSWEGIPIVSSNMDTTGTFEIAKELAKHKMLTCIHKFYDIEEWTEFLAELNDDEKEHIAVSSGITTEDLSKLDKIISMDDKIKWICLDVANGYMESFHTAVSQIRERYPNKIIIAGNIADIEGYKLLSDLKVDIIKAGIGGGSACTTRIKTGVGYPQLSMIMDIKEDSHKYPHSYLMSDGGCCVPGDICKAFGAGADFVMLGGMFAGHDESGGDIVRDDKGRLCREFYGMSSKEAMETHYETVNPYRTSEGKSVLIPFRGEIEHTIRDILGGLRSACTYTNSKTIGEFTGGVSFIRVQEQENRVYS